MTANRLAVVVVSYRTPELTASAAQSGLDSGAEAVVIIDNASGDDTLHRLRPDGRLSVLENARNQGFGEAANLAARSVNAQHLIFLNSDATLTAEATSAMLTELDRLGERAIVGPRLVGIDGEIQRSAGLLPAPLDLAMRALGLHAIGRKLAGVRCVGAVMRRSRIMTEYSSAQTAHEPIDTTMVSGACFAISQSAFHELDGFDERFFMYFEDADLCRRAATAGMAIRYVPAAVISHVGGASSSEDYHFGPLHARSMRQYLGKWYGPAGSALALILLWLRAAALTIALQPQAGRSRRAFWAALWDRDPRR